MYVCVLCVFVWVPVVSYVFVCVVSVCSHQQEEERHMEVREEVCRDIDCTVLTKRFKEKWLFWDEGI